MMISVTKNLINFCSVESSQVDLSDFQDAPLDNDDEQPVQGDATPQDGPGGFLTVSKMDIGFVQFVLF